MNRITSGDLIDTGDYIIGEKHKVINFMLNGIYQQISDYDNTSFKEKDDTILENLVDNMENVVKVFDKISNLEDDDIIKVDYSNNCCGLKVIVYGKKEN